MPSIWLVAGCCSLARESTSTSADRSADGNGSDSILRIRRDPGALWLRYRSVADRAFYLVAQLTTAAKPKGYYHAFLERHIEQGGILDQKKINIGVVEGIVGINQWKVTIAGKANQAGTTPMDQRQDAMVAAAKLTLAVNQAVTSVAGRQVATVGQMHAEPGAPNVIPGKVTMSIEIRDLSHEKVPSVFRVIREQATAIEKETGTKISYEQTNETLPALTNKRIQEMVSTAAKSLGLSSIVMPSGSGHDTQDMATLAPTGMIFVPSKNGVRHAPDEYTSPLQNRLRALYAQ